MYALQDAIVLRAWTYPNGNCGIGLSIRTADGQSWTYCHLSYLDPAITRGVQLAGGTQLGLVGSTGHATGPHLHLQLDPTTSYPQEQAWFQSFAGHRVPLAGRRPDGLRVCGQPSIHGRTTGRRSSKGFGCPLHPLRG